MTTEEFKRFQTDDLLKEPIASKKKDCWILSARMKTGETKDLAGENGTTKTFKSLSDVLDFLSLIEIDGALKIAVLDE